MLFLMGSFLLHFQHLCFFGSVMNDKWEGGLWVLQVAAFLFFLVPLPIMLVLNELRKSAGRRRVQRDSQAWQTQTRRQKIPVDFKNVKGTRQRQWDSEKSQETQWQGFCSGCVDEIYALCCLWESYSKTFLYAITLKTCQWVLLLYSCDPICNSQLNSLKITRNVYAPTSSEGTIEQAKGDITLWRSPQDRINVSLWVLWLVSDLFFWVNCVQLG